MRFTISREQLQEGLAAVAASIPAKTTLPVLANILVETTEKGIRISGTDLDIAVSTEVVADVESQGAITIAPLGDSTSVCPSGDHASALIPGGCEYTGCRATAPVR